MNNATLIGFIFLIIAFFGLGLCLGNRDINDTVVSHCESIAEKMPYSSIEECVVELTR